MTRMTKATMPAAPPPETDKSRRLEVMIVPGKSQDRLLTDLVADGIATNASTAMRFVRPDHGDDLSLTDMVASLREHGAAVNRADLSSAERMLNAQAVALNAIFAEMARRAALNMGDYMDATDRYMRLALKAQSQCRATVETLAAIKNPPTVFARQANINNGGQQQVNNGPTPPRPRETASQPNELLEDGTNGSTQLDTRATAAASSKNQGVESVGALNWPAQR